MNIEGMIIWGFLPLVWLCQHKNKHRVFRRSPKWQCYPLLLIWSVSNWSKDPDRVQFSISNDFVDLTGQVSLKCNCILRQVYKFFRFTTRPLKTAEKVLDRSLLISKGVMNHWHHSQILLPSVYRYVRRVYMTSYHHMCFLISSCLAYRYQVMPPSLIAGLLISRP
jgi:hypothetical protein